MEIAIKSAAFLFEALLILCPAKQHYITRMTGDDTLGKLDINKKAKEESLLKTAYHLFIENGVSKTSVSDITKSAGVTKGTFYLYFKDKYDLKNRLVSYHSSRLFEIALAELELCKNELSFNERIIFLIDNILSQLENNKPLLVFISKNLSWGIFKSSISTAQKHTEDFDFIDVYQAMLRDAPGELEDPEIMLYMIVELINSTCYSAILHSEPVPLEKLKPHLYRCVNEIIGAHLKKTEPSE